MKTEFSPIPITILDFLGVLIPGWIWLILFSATVEYIETLNTNPFSAWTKLSFLQKEAGPWFGSLTIIFLAITIGYCLKSVSMIIAQYFSKYLFRFASNVKECSSKEMVFPYNKYFSSKGYYIRVTSILAKIFDINSTDQFPGKTPFSPAKRYLRLLSPDLWQESEKMEAEVRMIGGLFLGGLYGSLLSLLVVITNAINSISFPDFIEMLWLLFLFGITFLLGYSFNRTRLHEVENTYMNMLLSEGLRIQKDASNQKIKSDY